MQITEIYKTFKENLPKEQFELKWNGNSFYLYFKEYDNKIQILVCEEWCIPYIPNKSFSCRYGSKNIHVIVQRIFDMIVFLKAFAEYMEQYILNNSAKYGFIEIIDGGEQ